MARTRQTARKSVGGKASRQELERKAARRQHPRMNFGIKHDICLCTNQWSKGNDCLQCDEQEKDLLAPTKENEITSRHVLEKYGYVLSLPELDDDYDEKKVVDLRRPRFNKYLFVLRERLFSLEKQKQLEQQAKPSQAKPSGKTVQTQQTIAIEQRLNRCRALIQLIETMLKNYNLRHPLVTEKAKNNELAKIPLANIVSDTEKTKIVQMTGDIKSVVEKVRENKVRENEVKENKINSSFNDLPSLESPRTCSKLSLSEQAMRALLISLDRLTQDQPSSPEVEIPPPPPPYPSRYPSINTVPAFHRQQYLSRTFVQRHSYPTADNNRSAAHLQYLGAYNKTKGTKTTRDYGKSSRNYANSYYRCAPYWHRDGRR